MYERGLDARVVDALSVEHVLGRQPLPKSRGAASAPHPPSPWQGEGEGAFERCALLAARPPSLAFSRAPSRSVNPRRAGCGWRWGAAYLGASVGVSEAHLFCVVVGAPQLPPYERARGLPYLAGYLSTSAPCSRRRQLPSCSRWRCNGHVPRHACEGKSGRGTRKQNKETPESLSAAPRFCGHWMWRRGL